MTFSRSLRTTRARWLAGLLTAATLGAVGCHTTAPATNATPDTPEARKAAKEPYTKPTSIPRHIYPPIEAAPGDIAKAEKQAAAQKKNVLLDFGGDWCGDCEVLDRYFHQEPNASLLDKNFVEVKVNIGYEDANLDLAHKYGVPIHGVPALAVLSPDGKVLYAQDKQFSDMRYMEPTYLTAFLNKWKPA